MNKVFLAGRDYGWLLAIGLAALAFAFIYLKGPTVVGAPLPTSKQVVPATGEQGFPVEAFCNDSATTVTKDFVAPPESTFAATYNLDRTAGGVHEVVTVGVYRDTDRQPAATHYDSANTPSDAFVSKKALDCVVKKAK